MLPFLFVIATLFASILSRPQEGAPSPLLAARPGAPAGSAPSPIPIVSQTEETNPDGSFKFSYETGNGIKFEESGYLKDNGTSEDKIQVIQGSVSYTDNAGNVINLKYIADENGFQPEGDHIPTAPPVPQGIARSLQQSPDSQQSAIKAAPPHAAQPYAENGEIAA